MKNWSSLILFNNERCTRLSPAYVNEASGLDLHQFRWLAGPHEIGGIPSAWNHLVDYESPRPVDEIANLHYTNGGPYFEDYSACGYANAWFAERDRMMTCAKPSMALPRAG
jgi:hypothetical protein